MTVLSVKAPEASVLYIFVVQYVEISIVFCNSSPDEILKMKILAYHYPKE
jgi:hypothetical protein